MANLHSIAGASATATGRLSGVVSHPGAAVFRGPFASPLYRRFWFAALLSYTAFWVQVITRSWMIQDMTGSPLLVSLIPITMMLPMLIVSIPAGIIADRVNRRGVIVAMEFLALGGYLATTAVTLAGEATVWNVLALSTLTGVVMAMAGPSRMAMIPSLVPVEESRRAIGLSALVFNVSQIAGPAVGGVIIAQLGTETALAVSAVVSMPALLLYASVRPEAEARRARCKDAPLLSVKQGFQYVFGNPALRSMLVGALILVATIGTWGALMPTFAADVLHRGPGVLGMLTLAVGFGALIGSLLAVVLTNGASQERVETVNASVLVVSVIGFALSPWLELSLFFAALAGLTQTTYMVTNMTVMQMSASEEFRGRVLSIRFLVMGIQPVGILGLGLFAEAAGPQAAVIGIALVGTVAYVIVLAATRRHRTAAKRAQQPGLPAPETAAHR